MLILSTAAFEEAAAGSYDLLEWPGTLCVWTGPGLSPALPGDAFEIDFDPAPSGLAAGLRATLSRLAYFGHRPEGAVLCAERVPAAAELNRLRKAAEGGDWTVLAPKRGLRRIGRKLDGIVMLGASLSCSPDLARALRALPADLGDDDAVSVFEGLGRDLREGQEARP